MDSLKDMSKEELYYWMLRLQDLNYHDSPEDGRLRVRVSQEIYDRLSMLEDILKAVCD